jgi:hypothetical protein
VFASRPRQRSQQSAAKLCGLLMVVTIPARILELLVESKLRSVFASAQFGRDLLCLSGALLYGAELLRRRAERCSRSCKPPYEVGARLAEWDITNFESKWCPTRPSFTTSGDGTTRLRPTECDATNPQLIGDLADVLRTSEGGLSQGDVFRRSRPELGHRFGVGG